MTRHSDRARRSALKWEICKAVEQQFCQGSGQGQQPKAKLAPAPSNSVAQARLREALTAGGPGTKEKGPPVADGFLSVTPDTPEAIEFRSRRSIFDSVGASSSYLEDETGPKPSELYGKFTWRIENFSEIGKRELRSTIFEVGSYKWYILVYPQGCDVCNHLSLFLCVADYDKLLPGWSHFAQFTIAVVNKDPKKSKYSDTLHRFCKKEHDWGWKKFMELNKVLEGFTVNNTLVIKAQVQVIRDRPSTPFRCLDAQYRRELVRVYLTNVETICRKFVDEKRESLAKLREDTSGFRLFLGSLDPRKRRALATEKGEGILKGVVKRFFNEKEVTSTLVMDALFSGCKQLEEYGRMADSKKGKKEKPSVVIHADKHVFALTGDILALLDRAATETIPPFRDDKASDQLALRNAQDVDDYSKDYVERDERRLADLGRRAVEMYAVSQVFADLQAAHSEAESIKLQDALIKEEEEAERMEDQRQAARMAVERERKARKKERRRAKKESDAATEAEKKQEEEEQARLVQEAAARHRKEEKAAQQARQAASAAASHSSPPAVADARKSQQPSEAPTRQASAASIPDNAAARFGEAETTGRSLGAEDEPSRNGRRAANSLATARSSADVSDDDSSTTSRSGNDEKPTVSTQQFEAHIEYLKGELARATSQLNASRTELAASKEALVEAQTEVEQLRTELTLVKAELAARPALPHRDSDRSVAAPSAPSVASSYSAMNAIEINSIVSSTENETPSRAGSLDLTADTASARGSGTQDLLEAHPSGDIGNGAPPPPPYSRRPAWGGAPGPAHQELHASAAHAGPQHYNHVVHAQPQQAQLGAPSKSGTLPSVRQPPPPPPPAEPRAGPTLRAGSMPRQASIGPPLKESTTAAPRQQSRGPVQQQSPGMRPGNGVHAGPKRSGAAHELHGVSRLGNKAKTSLNGNAPSFVPGTPSAPQQPAAANGGHVPNGHHAVSYRNAAAGLLTASSGETSDQNGAAAGSQVQMPSGKAVKSPASMAIGKPRGGLAGHNLSMPTTPGSIELGSSPVPGPLHVMNGSADGSFSPTTYGMASQPQHSMPFSSPIQPKKSEPNGPADSPGLDDFAHMGLINDLLE